MSPTYFDTWYVASSWQVTSWNGICLQSVDLVVKLEHQNPRKVMTLGMSNVARGLLPLSEDEEDNGSARSMKVPLLSPYLRPESLGIIPIVAALVCRHHVLQSRPKETTPPHDDTTRPVSSKPE